MMRAALVAMSLAVAMPCFAEVRVISGDIEHVVGPGGKVLDDADLQARNQRAWEHMHAERQLAIEKAQVAVEVERLKLQNFAVAYGMSQNWDPVDQNWDSTGGGWFIGSTRTHSGRSGIPPRVANPRGRRAPPKIGPPRRRSFGPPCKQQP